MTPLMAVLSHWLSARSKNVIDLTESPKSRFLSVVACPGLSLVNSSSTFMADSFLSLRTCSVT